MDFEWDDAKAETNEAKHGVTFAEAYQRTLAAGFSVLVSDDGFIFEVFPDGTRKMIKQIKLPMLVVKGSRLKISQ